MELRHILVPTDLSPASRRAYPHAAELARKFDAKITLLHVDDLREHSMPESEAMHRFLADAVLARDSQLDTAVELFKASDLKVEVEVVPGKPWVEIDRYSARHAVDLVVMTRHGVEGPRLPFGSTTRRVLRRARVPVLVAHDDDEVATAISVDPPGAAYRTLVVTTDFSEDSLRGFKVAMELAHLFELDVHLVHVLRTPAVWPTLPGEPTLIVPEALQAELAAHAEAEMAAQVQAAPGHEVRCSLNVARHVDAAVSEICEEVDADLVVIPTHGAGALRSFFLGSTAEAVAKDLRRPVLVLPRAWLAAVEG